MSTGNRVLRDFLPFYLTHRVPDLRALFKADFVQEIAETCSGTCLRSMMELFLFNHLAAPRSILGGHYRGDSLTLITAF